MVLGFIFGLILAAFVTHSIQLLLQQDHYGIRKVACIQCGADSDFVANIPVLDMLIHLRKCPACGSPRSSLYLSLQILLIAGSMVAFHQYPVLEAAQIVSMAGFLSGVTVLDIRKQTIPNLYLLLILGIAIIGLLAGSVGLQQALYGLLVGAIVSILLIVPQWAGNTKLNELGLGDVKLVLVVSLWLGWILTIYMMFLASVAGVVAYLITWLFNGFKPKYRLAFGPFVALFTLLFGIGRVIDPQFVTHLLSFRF